MAKTSVKKSATKKRVVKKKAISESPAKKSTTKKSPAKKSTAKKKVVRKIQKPVTRKSASTGNEIALKAVLVINDAKTLYAELGKKLEAKKDILIDASAVEMVDTAILQLLLAFIRKSQLQNISVEWVKPSQEFLSRSETLNLTSLLGLSEERRS